MAKPTASALQSSVLIVEDDPDWAELLVDLLRTDTQLEVRRVSSYTEARVEMMARNLDLAIVDIRLTEDSDPNDVSGLHLVNWLRQTGKGVPIIILSAYGTIEVVRKAFKDYNVYDFFNKARLDPQELRNAVTNALRRES